jgi:AraC-like DNA-binding protein
MSPNWTPLGQQAVRCTATARRPIRATFIARPRPASCSIKASARSIPVITPADDHTAPSRTKIASHWRSPLCSIGNEAERLKISRSSQDMIVETTFVGLPRHFAWQNTEFVIAATIKALREMAGKHFQPAQVTFTLARNSELPEFERFFGCPVAFSAPIDRLTLSNETLAIPLVTEDPHLLEALRPICEEAAKEHKTVRGTLRSLVENEVHKVLHHGKANRQRVAKALGLSVQTLSEGLAEENTSFDHVVDRLRHSLALQYIEEQSLSAAQIAWLLGYEGPTSFNNAFARWTGRSASGARTEKRPFKG